MAAERFQIREDLAGAAVGSDSIFGEGTVKDAPEIQRNYIRKRWSFIKNGKNRCRRGLAIKRIFAGDHFGDDTSQGPDVASLIHWLSESLLGRHITDGARPYPRLRG